MKAERPTIVLVHGYPDSPSVWDLVAARLHDRYDVVAHDLRESRGWTFDALIEHLASTVDAACPDRPVHLVGHDWGSIVGWEAVTTERLRGRISSFTSISGPSLDHVGRWMRDRPAGRRAWLRQGVRSGYIAAFQVPVLPGLFWRLAGARAFTRYVERIEGAQVDDAWPARSFGTDAAKGVQLYRANVPARLRRPRLDATTDVPVQLIVPRDDRFVTPALLEGIEEIAPNLWRRDVPGSHWIPRTHPERVARWIAEAVDRVEASDATFRVSRPPVVVVTGAGSGIGRETALAFAERGSLVVGADIDGAAAARTAELCRLVAQRANVDGGAVPYTVDVGDGDAMEAFAKAVEADHGVPRIVINNAGIGVAGAFLDTGVDDWERVLHVNLWGLIHGNRLFVRQMVERGEGGHVVNVASAAGFAPSRGLSAYATTKAAAIMLSECIRAEVAGEGIGVSAICPGVIDTGITSRTRFVGVSDAEQDRRRRATSALYRRRGFTPDKVAAAIVDAVERDLAVVPVSPEARMLQLLPRISPRAARRFARLDLPV